MIKTLTLGPVLCSQKNFSRVLPLLVSSYHPVQLKGKLMNQTLENYEKLILGPILTRLVHIWAHQMFS